MGRPRLRKTPTDRRAHLLHAACLLVLAACAGSPSPRGEPLAPGETASLPAVDLGKRQVIARNALAYHVALAPRYLVSVELSTQFDLVVRARSGQDDSRATRRIRLDAPTYDILDLVLSRAGDTAYVASAAGWVRRYSLADGVMQQEWRMGSAVTALALSDDDAYLFIGSDRGTLCLRRLRDGAQLQCMIAHQGRVGAVAVHGDRLATASWQGELALWAIPSLANTGNVEGSGSIAALAFAPDGKTLAVARNKLPPVRNQEIADQEIRSANIHEAGANLIELYKVQGDQLSTAVARRFVGHRSIISDLVMSATELVSVSWDRSVRLWHIETARETRRLRGFQHILRGLALSPATGELFVAGWALDKDGAAVTGLRLFFPARRSR